MRETKLLGCPWCYSSAMDDLPDWERVNGFNWNGITPGMVLIGDVMVRWSAKDRLATLNVTRPDGSLVYTATHYCAVS